MCVWAGFIPHCRLGRIKVKIQEYFIGKVLYIFLYDCGFIFYFLSVTEVKVCLAFSYRAIFLNLGQMRARRMGMWEM